MLEWYWYLVLALAGFGAGVVNTIAGGGSFLTLPALMYIYGLEPNLANGTNRVAILFSSLVASAKFRKEGTLDQRLALRLTIPTLIGALGGALLAIHLPAEAFEPAFGAIFVAMAVLILLNPKRLIETRTAKSIQTVGGSVGTFFVFAGIGVYVGFIQAGMGILLLLGMSFLSSGDLVASNSVKNLVGFLVTLAATLVFVYFQQIVWLPGVVMAVGNVLGGVAGARLALAKGSKLIFAALVVVMIATGLKLILS